MLKLEEFKDMPGPRGWPLFGSALQLTSFPEKTLLDWSNHHYGNVFRYRMFSQDCVVLNGYEAIKEGFLSNKNEMSGRIEGPVFEAIRDNGGLFFLRYGEAWKTWKPFVVKSVGTVMSDLPEKISYQARQFLYEDLKNVVNEGVPVGLTNYLQSRMAQIVLTSFMNKDFLLKKKNELEELVFDIYAPVTDLRFPILMFAPSMSYFPPFSSYLADEKTRRSKLVNKIVGWIEERKFNKSIEYEKDLTGLFFQEHPDADRSDLESLALVLVDMIFGGSATVTNQLLWVLLFLLKHPDMMEEVQLEIEESMKSLKSISDLYKHQDSVPFLNAAIEEAMRMRPIAPGSMFHKTITDTIVGKYKIPKDVVIYPNLWSVHHDTKYWGSDVESFRPDRHLDKEGKFVKSGHVIPFSIGDRKCPGKEIAEADIFIFLAEMLYRFDISLAPEHEHVNMSGSSGAILKVPDFKVRITHRHMRR